MAMLIISTSSPAEEGGCSQEPEHPAIQTGYIALGEANKPTGTAWYDTSLGVSYGNGQRFEREEIASMTRVPSKHERK